MINLNAGGAFTATGAAYTYDIKERLCKAYCPNNTIQPVVSRNWQIVDSQLVGTIMYYTIQPIVTIVYQPKSSTSTVTKSFIEDPFTISFPSATSTSTIAFTDTVGYTEPVGCCPASSHGVRCVGNLGITFTPAP